MNRYQSPVQNTLESYVPIPLGEIQQAGAATQQRYNAAEEQDAQSQAKLSNIRAVYSDQADWVKQNADKYHTDSQALINKWDGRMDDPGYKREADQLINTYAGNPNYKTVSESNAKYDNQTKLYQLGMSKGNSMYDPNANFTGSINGRLAVPTENVSQLTHDSDFNEQLDKAHFSKDLNGTSTPNDSLDNIVRNMATNPAFSKILQQGTIEQMVQNGIRNPTLARNAALLHFKGMADARKYRIEDPELDLQRSKVSAQSSLVDKEAGLPEYDTGQGGWNTSSNTYSHDNQLSRFSAGIYANQDVSLYKGGESSVNINNQQLKNTTVHGQGMYVVGQGDQNSLSPTNKDYHIEEGKFTGYATYGVVQEGPNKGKLVATGNKDSDGHYGTTASQDIHTDPASGDQFINWGIKNRSNPAENQQRIQMVGVKRYQDDQKHNMILKPLSADESRTIFGLNFSQQNSPDQYQHTVAQTKASGVDKARSTLDDPTGLGLGKGFYDEFVRVNKAVGSIEYSKDPEMMELIAKKHNMDRKIEDIASRAETQKRRQLFFNDTGKRQSLSVGIIPSSGNTPDSENVTKITQED